MFRPQYFCCAIPLVNVGIYTLMSEQFILASVAGVLTISTPSVVGAHVPSFLPYIFCGLCFLTAGIQLVGFYGVFKERTRTFRTYSLASALSFCLAFGCAAALIALSGVGHGSAVRVCEANYFSAADNSTTTASTTSGEGKALCNAFAWADVGIMGGLWLLFAVVQGYCILISRGYSNEQKEDHQKYKSIYSQNAEEYRMSQFYGPNADAWDHRPSVESLRDEQSPYHAGEQGSNDGKPAMGTGHDRAYQDNRISVPPGEENPQAYEYEQDREAHGREETGAYRHQEEYGDAPGGGYDNLYDAQGQGGHPHHSSDQSQGYDQEHDPGRTPTMRDYPGGQSQGRQEYPAQHAYSQQFPPGYAR